MKRRPAQTKHLFPCLVVLLASLCLFSCTSGTQSSSSAANDDATSTKDYIIAVLDEPKTTDFQCTTIDYTIALNVFDRLVETHTQPDGGVNITPSLAKSWEVSDDGRTYTFHLRDDVTFSNGSPLTASDVRYTFLRLLTNPNSVNQDIASDIVGASELMAGTTNDLSGFHLLGTYDFEIVLEQPFAAFMACLCTPSASILDEQSTEEAGEQFGIDPAATVGTGPFVFREWRKGEGLLLAANQNCWAGAPKCAGVNLRFVDDPPTLDKMFKDGQLDIINVDDLGDLGDFYLHGSKFEQQLNKAPHVAIDYIALNESVKPLDDVRVRKALQFALDRQTLLDAAYSGTGQLENGIFPHGLFGFNKDLPAIPHDPKEAKRLLAESGHANGFELEICLRATTPQWQRSVMEMAASMWGEVGVRANISILGEEEFMDQRTSGKLPCYTASWAADFNDPDNFIYTFFGTRENAIFRSLNYGNEDVMRRVRAARAITDEKKRIAEYDDLERIIVQEDAAWIPLFSRDRHFLTSTRLQNFSTMWNGWYEGEFEYMSINEASSNGNA